MPVWLQKKHRLEICLWAAGGEELPRAAALHHESRLSVFAYDLAHIGSFLLGEHAQVQGHPVHVLRSVEEKSACASRAQVGVTWCWGAHRPSCSLPRELIGMQLH